MNGRPALSAARQAALDEVAVPVEGGSLVAAGVDRDDNGWRTIWLRDGGRRRERFGAAEGDSRVACAIARYLNERSFGPAK